MFGVYCKNKQMFAYWSVVVVTEKQKENRKIEDYRQHIKEMVDKVNDPQQLRKIFWNIEALLTGKIKA